MGKQFQKALLMGTVCCALSLGACALTSEDKTWHDEWDETIVEEVEVDPNADGIFIEEKVCSDGNCLPTDDYLVNQFVQEKTIPTPEKTDVLALSRPSSSQATSVREKLAAKNKEEDPVWYTETAIPEKEPETVVTAAAVTKPVTVTTTTETETGIQATAEPTAEPAKPIVEVAPAGSVPLKKVTTTITETTTKYVKEKTEKPETKDKEAMTLEEKIAYGREVHDWEANSGNTLRQLLMSWGEDAGWTVVWKLDRDYHLEAGVIFRGTFTDVSAALIRSFARATPAPIGTFYQGNRVLLINTQEDDNER